MRYFLIILFLLCFFGLITGFIIQPGNKSLGDLFIGLSMLGGFFVWMPFFIYHRWRHKDIRDYYLNRENLMKMRAYRESQSVGKRSRKIKEDRSEEDSED